MKKGKLLRLAVNSLAIFSFCFLIVSGSAQAGLLSTVEDGGLKQVGSKGFGSSVNTVLDPRVMVARAITKLLGFLGIILVAFIIYSGWQYMSAGGDKAKIDEAKKRIVNAVIGLVLVVSAFSIANFVIECASYVGEPGILTNLMCQ
jgi:hypothetical protein